MDDHVPYVRFRLSPRNHSRYLSGVNRSLSHQGLGSFLDRFVVLAHLCGIGVRFVVLEQLG